jgi:broad specificity phosphatase PhoE
VAEIVLARHALAGSNHTGIASCGVPGEPLTPEGVEQARRLGEMLAGDDVELGVSSRLGRTRETLSLALAGRDVPTLVVPELDEIRFGSFDGGLLDTYRLWASTNQPTEPAPGGGESRAEAAARFARGLRLVLERHERTILVVAHALVLRYALDAADGLVPASLMAPVEHATPFRLDRAAVERAAELLEDWSRSPSFRAVAPGT